MLRYFLNDHTLKEGSSSPHSSPLLTIVASDPLRSSNLPVVPSTDTIQEIAFGGVAGVAVVAIPALFLYAAVFPSTGPVAGSIAANCMRLLHQRRSKKTRER